MQVCYLQPYFCIYTSIYFFHTFQNCQRLFKISLWCCIVDVLSKELNWQINLPISINRCTEQLPMSIDISMNFTRSNCVELLSSSGIIHTWYQWHCFLIIAVIKVVGDVVVSSPASHTIGRNSIPNIAARGSTTALTSMDYRDYLQVLQSSLLELPVGGGGVPNFWYVTKMTTQILKRLHLFPFPRRSPFQDGAMLQ